MYPVTVSNTFEPVSKQYLAEEFEKQFNNLAVLLNKSFQSMQEYMDKRFTAIEIRLDKIEGRLDKIEARLSVLEDRLTSLEQEVENIRLRLDRGATQMDLVEVEKRVFMIEQKLGLPAPEFRPKFQ